MVDEDDLGDAMTAFLTKMLWVLGAAAWYIIRHPFKRSSRRRMTARHIDWRRESLLVAVSFCGLFALPFLYIASGQPEFADYSFRPAQAGAGLLVLGGSLWLLWRTHRDLGGNWSAKLEIRDDHCLMTSGIYNHIRHPMYSAFWLWALAQALLLPNWIAGFSGVVCFGILFFCRINREERMMIEAFGDEYRSYMARTRRLIPGIY
jgi:protein-S-isoprenylcysteine O-methyltransferase Ste14